MACYHPIPALRDGFEVRLHPPLGTANLSVPCGRCLGCREARALQWSYRIMHEAGRHPSNLFITLTYDEAHLPPRGSLVPRDLQLFLKRLRRAVDGETVLSSDRVRFFACGEYGSTTFRPHYHLIAFDLDFADKLVAGKDLYQSDKLDKLWGMGACRFGTVTAQSARYVAGYSVKAFGSSYADADGVPLVAPFCRMSRRPGIGSNWLDAFGEDLKFGYLVVEGRKSAVPRAYLRRLEKLAANPREPRRREFGQLADTIRGRAAQAQYVRPPDSRSRERLQDAERIHKARLGLQRQGEKL